MLDLDEGVPPSRLEPQFYSEVYLFLVSALEVSRLRPEAQASPDCHSFLSVPEVVTWGCLPREG